MLPLATPPGWPFFAPSADDAVARAFDLAELTPGDHLVDLGCGDGRVLVAAAQRGAVVTGIECDEDLAAEAMAALRSAGAARRSRVVVADLFQPDVLRTLTPPPDVLFSYLSPATLQRLTPALRRLRGTRLVTVDYAVPDLVAEAGDDPPDHGTGPDGPAGEQLGGVEPTNGSARLYRLPGRLRRARPAQVGWSSAGTLCVMPTEAASLTYLEAVHPGGHVELHLTGELGDHASYATGCDRVDPGRPVAVDLRWQPRPPGTLAHGEVHLTGLPPHPLTVLFADDDQGHWDLSPDGATTLATRLRSEPPPATTHALLALLDP